ncbi:MAG: flagellar hook-basal body complex protein [Phycisphaerales bacterium]|nr:MAG: flagellar hook-basal body complex protein [Phycisphaerales bacterium]
MSFVLLAGITGPQHNKEAFDIGGNDADINRAGPGAGAATFSELLNETIGKSSQALSDVSQTDPLQQSHAAATNGASAGISRGKIVCTGKPLDLAIDGEGCLVLTDGQRDFYTRTGSFAVDSTLNIADPATGYRLKRIGSEGEADGFQTPDNSNIRVPYSMPLPAKATSEIAVSGNLSANTSFSTPSTQKIASDVIHTYDNGVIAEETTQISKLDQFSGVFASGTITFGGYHKDGKPFDADLSLPVDQSTTLGDIIGHLNANVLDGSTASLSNGRIQITDDTSGYSRTDMTISYSGEGSLASGAYFEILTPGGEETSNVDLTAFDSRGNKHPLSVAFVKTDSPNTWDVVLTSAVGDIHEIEMRDRRINAITFDPNTGSLKGPSNSETAQFVITFASDKANPQTIRINMGTPGKLDGLTQFAGNSTPAERSQDGFGPGTLSTISVNNRGAVVGTFSNGVKKNIGTVQIAMFRNTAALERASGGYYIPTVGSGAPLLVRAMSGGAGAIRSGALEKSESDVATDFVNMIQTQNSYRSIDILKELNGLIG